MSAEDSSSEGSVRGGQVDSRSPASPAKPLKKRVNFSEPNSPPPELLQTPDTPERRSSRESRGSINAVDEEELAYKLELAISNGEIERRRETLQPEIVISEPGSPLPVASPLQSPGTPRTIRPVLRRNTSYDVAREREVADEMDRQATPQKLQSMTSAHHRANQLAVSLNPETQSRSAPGSRRNSLEMARSFQDALQDDRNAGSPDLPSPMLGASQDPSRSQASSRAASPRPSSHKSLRRRFFPRLHEHDPEDDEWLDSPEMRQADRIVKSQFQKYRDRMRGNSRSRDSSPVFDSGASTPVGRDPSIIDDDDYVPRPARYRPTILSSLWALNAPYGRRGDSTATTPDGSPSNSQPNSRSNSPVRDWPASPGGGRSGLRSPSTVSLTDFGKGITDNLKDRLRRQRNSFSSSRLKEHATIKYNIAETIFRHEYLEKLCRALMQFGAPSHRLEDYMRMTARVLEIEGHFLYLPGCMFFNFGDKAIHTTEVKIIRAPHGVDFGRLSDVHDIYKRVVRDKMSVVEANELLDEVCDRKPRYTKMLRVLFFGFASLCVAPFGFQGNVRDLGPAFVLGAWVGVLQLYLAPRHPLYGQVFEVVAAITTSFGARAFGAIKLAGHDTRLFCFSALAQSSIALILPGWFVLTAALELQSGNIISGSVRMVWSLIYTLFLGYGTTVGATLYGTMDRVNAPSEVVCAEPMRPEFHPLCVVGFTICLAMVNQAKIKQLPIMVFISLAAWCVNNYSKRAFGDQTTMSVMLGALTVGILANMYSRLGRKFSNMWVDLTEWLEGGKLCNIGRGLVRFGHRMKRLPLRLKPWSKPPAVHKEWPTDPESRPASPTTLVDEEKSSVTEHEKRKRKVGYSLAAAAMLPAIFVQVPSGLASKGFLLAGVTDANAINSNSHVAGGNAQVGDAAFLYSVVQVAIGISVGLFMSAIIVYPLGKRRSGLFSF